MSSKIRELEIAMEEIDNEINELYTEINNLPHSYEDTQDAIDRCLKLIGELQIEKNILIEELYYIENWGNE